jgi:hypothetical protein
MTTDGLQATVRGLPELKAALLSIPDKLRVRALRNALAAGARVVQARARFLTPILKLTTRSGQRAYRKGYRKPGTVRQAISVRTSKAARRQGNVGVFVNVRPAKGTARGAKSPRDPFYWRWIDKGWNPAGADRTAAGKRERRKLAQSGGAKRKPGVFFMRGAATKLDDALKVFLARIVPLIQKLNVPKAPPP